MYSIVLMAAMAASPDVPQALLCPVNPSRYGSDFWLKHCFYDCCAPARYGWVDCWSKGNGVYPGGRCGTGHFYNPGACSCAPCGGGYAVGAACASAGCNPCWGQYEWGIGNQPAYYTGVTGCPPHVTAPPYARYTQSNPCCTHGHFAFDSGLIGHSHGVGYAGFGGYGNFGFYGGVPMGHPPTTADLPPFPRNWEYAVPGTPGAGANVPMPPIPGAGRLPLGPTPDRLTPMPLDPGAVPPVPPDALLPKSPLPVPPDSLLPKPPAVTPIPVPDPPKADPKVDPKKLGAARPEPATVVLSVPAGAVVTVEGQALRSTGRERSFRTPPLAPGRDYTYQIRATLMVAGVEEVEVREVTVTAGLISRASFEKLFAKVEGPAPVMANGK